MPAKKIIFRQQPHAKMLSGINTLTEAVKITLGPRARTVVLVDDALQATRAAVEEGILPGGGVALLRARTRLLGLHGETPDHDAGIKIVLRALEAPLRQIVENAGADPSVVPNKVVEGNGNFGFNALTNQYGDWVPMDVLDPCKVTRTALQTAASIAGLVLTTDCMIAQWPEESRKPTSPSDDDAMA